ncbi:MAG: WecB/TagA/CpsF family glycosyltransferase [Pseudomonadota bacterium]
MALPCPATPDAFVVSAPAPRRPTVVTITTGSVSVDVTETDQHSLLADLADRLSRGIGFTVATLNFDHLVKLGRDPAFRESYARHTHVTADGRPITWLSRLARGAVGLVTGADLVEPLVEHAARGGHPIAMIGTTEQNLRRASDQLQARHPGLTIAARISPPFGLHPDSDAAMAAVDDAVIAGAELIFLAFGAPCQERIAARASERYPQIGFVSVGAGIDFIAGGQTRAPRWVRRLGVEWAWRVVQEPRRLGPRYVDCLLLLPKTAFATGLRFKATP